jgi:hypothetical protein
LFRNPKGTFMPELPHSEHSSPAPIRVAGTRRVTLTMRAEIDKADSFADLPRGTAKPLQILAAFEQALPYLALPALTQRLVGFLVRCTEPQDWEEGSHPIAWPSATNCKDLLGCFAAARENADPLAGPRQRSPRPALT